MQDPDWFLKILHIQLAYFVVETNRKYKNKTKEKDQQENSMDLFYFPTYQLPHVLSNISRFARFLHFSNTLNSCTN